MGATVLLGLKEGCLHAARRLCWPGLQGACGEGQTGDRLCSPSLVPVLTEGCHLGFRALRALNQTLSRHHPLQSSRWGGRHPLLLASFYS